MPLCEVYNVKYITQVYWYHPRVPTPMVTSVTEPQSPMRGCAVCKHWTLRLGMLSSQRREADTNTSHTANTERQPQTSTKPSTVAAHPLHVRGHGPAVHEPGADGCHMSKRTAFSEHPRKYRLRSKRTCSIHACLAVPMMHESNAHFEITSLNFSNATNR